MTLSLKETRVPELRLPEISRESIARGLSEMRAPEMPDIDLSKVDLPKVDVSKAIADAALAVGITRPSRPRWPIVLGAAIIAGLTAWALTHKSAVRDRLEQTAQMARERINVMRGGLDESDDAVAFTAAETMPIEPGAYDDIAGALDDAGITAKDYPEGLGASGDMAGAEDGIPAFEPAKSRA
jgi:hypothetical protein